MAAMGTVLTNKYAEGYPAHRYYGGCEDVDIVENIARDRACRLFGAEHAECAAALRRTGKPRRIFRAPRAGDTVLGMNLAEGGHLTHGSPVLSGRLPSVAYGVDPATHRIDYEKADGAGLCGQAEDDRRRRERIPARDRFQKLRGSPTPAALPDGRYGAHGPCRRRLPHESCPWADVVTTTTHKRSAAGAAA